VVAHAAALAENAALYAFGKLLAACLTRSIGRGELRAACDHRLTMGE